MTTRFIFDPNEGMRDTAAKRVTDTLSMGLPDRELVVPIDRWDMPEVVREYLTTLDEAKRGAARDAAWSVVGSVAAASDAAWDAASAAAGDEGVTRAAAWAAAWATDRVDFDARVYRAMED